MHGPAFLNWLSFLPLLCIPLRLATGVEPGGVTVNQCVRCERVTVRARRGVVLLATGGAPHLASLDLSKCWRVEDEALLALAAHAPALSRLDLAHCWRVGRDAHVRACALRPLLRVSTMVAAWAEVGSAGSRADGGEEGSSSGSGAGSSAGGFGGGEAGDVVMGANAEVAVMA